MDQTVIDAFWFVVMFTAFMTMLNVVGVVFLTWIIVVYLSDALTICEKFYEDIDKKLKEINEKL